MKIKKTYTHCRVGLLLGLLNFHTLSSCVNTGGQLGMGLCQSKATKEQKELERQLEEQMKAFCRTNDGKQRQADGWKKFLSKPTAVGAPLTLAAVLAAGCYIYFNILSVPNPIENPMTNTTMSGNATTALTITAGPLDVLNTTVGSVGSTIKDITTTVGTVGIAALNATGIAGLLKPNGSASTTTPFPPTNSGTNTISIGNTTKSYNTKPTTAEQPFMDDIKAHNGSVIRMKYWLDRGKSINSVDPDGIPVVSYAASTNNWKLFKFLVDNKADLNLSDNEGYTPMMYIKPDASNSKLMYNYSLKHGASPCKRNVHGQRLDSKPGVKVSPEIFKKCS